MKLSKRYYKHLRYDESIMQSKTVGTMVEALEFGLRNPELLEDVVDFMIKKRKTCMKKYKSRKGNMSLLLKIEMENNRRKQNNGI
jgi:hypothetical protein